MDIAGKKLEINKRVVPSVSERHTSIEPGKCRSYAPLPAPYAHATPRGDSLRRRRACSTHVSYGALNNRHRLIPPVVGGGLGRSRTRVKIEREVAG